MRIREPKTTALVFASGKMVCNGAKSEEQSNLAARKVKATSDTVSLFHMLSNAGPIYCAGRNLVDWSYFQPFEEFWYRTILICCYFLAQYAWIIQKLGYPSKFKVMPLPLGFISEYRLPDFSTWHNWLFILTNRISRSRIWLARVMWNFQFVWTALLFLMAHFLI